MDLMSIGRTLIPRVVVCLRYPYPVYDYKVPARLSAVVQGPGPTHEKKAGMAFGVDSS